MSSPWFKFFPSDWLAGTSGMTPAERGVYITIVCLIYEMEGPIAHDAGRLARRCGCNKASFNRSLDALIQDGKLSVVDGTITNERAEKELSDRAIRSQKASITASKRWNAQGEKSEQKQQPKNANASAKQCMGDAIPEARSQNIEDTNVSLSPDVIPKPIDQITEAVSAYNVAAAESGWPKVQVVSPARRSALSARLKECGGLVGWQDALARAQASNHCCGQNNRGWVASFDFLTQQSSFTKLMEGNYDNRNPAPQATSPSGSGRPGSGTADAFAAVAGRMQRGEF